FPTRRSSDLELPPVIRAPRGAAQRARPVVDRWALAAAVLALAEGPAVRLPVPLRQRTAGRARRRLDRERDRRRRRRRARGGAVRQAEESRRDVGERIDRKRKR